MRINNFSSIVKWVLGVPENAIAGTDYIDTLARVNDTSAKLTMRPTLVAGRIGSLTRPTPIEVGCHAGYSLPISNGSDDEELFYREYVAGRWDGATDITASVICCLVATQTGDVNKYFKLQLSFENQPSATGTITASTHDIPVNVECADNEAK